MASSTLEARGDLWILDQYGLDRDWLHPSREEVFLWPQTKIAPHADLSEETAAFTKETRSRIIAGVVAKAVLVPCAVLEHRDVQLHMVGCEPQFHIPFTVTTDARRFAYDAETKITDVDSFAARLDDTRWDRLVRIAFCSIRFDEVQHLILALDGTRVVGEAWSVEETYVESVRVAPHTLRFSMRHVVALFDRSAPLLNGDAQRRVRWGIRSTLGRILPDDVVELIGDKVVAESDALTCRKFAAGSTAGVLHYSIARLLRVGWHAGMRTPSLGAYLRMGEAERRALQSTLNAIMRRRHVLFRRRLCAKTTRSGHGY